MATVTEAVQGDAPTSKFTGSRELLTGTSSAHDGTDRKVTGRAVSVYGAEAIQLPGLLHEEDPAKSARPRAELKSIDTADDSVASAHPGVMAVVTHFDLPWTDRPRSWTWASTTS